MPVKNKAFSEFFFIINSIICNLAVAFHAGQVMNTLVRARVRLRALRSKQIVCFSEIQSVSSFC